MTPKQFQEISEWQKATFGEATASSKIEHLKEELEELLVEIAIDGTQKDLEFADCFFLLFGAAAAAGMTYADIVNCIDRKFIINKSRKWGKPDQNGVVNHINP